MQPGDVADIRFLCKLKTGEIVAATDNSVGQQTALPKSALFLSRDKDDPVSVTAAVSLPGPPTGREWAFEDEIINRLAGVVVGMREGERRTVNLTAEELPERRQEEYVIRVARVRERQKEMRMPGTDYRVRIGKSPEIGQPFVLDPAIPGKVQSVTQEEVVIRFFAQPGDVVPTPFGPGHIRESEEAYFIDIDARKGALVRSAHLAGRITNVTDKIITIDYRHPFGYEELICDLTVNRVKRAEAKKEGTEEE